MRFNYFQEDFKYGEYDDHHTYNEAVDKGTYSSLYSATVIYVLVYINCYILGFFPYNCDIYILVYINCYILGFFPIINAKNLMLLEVSDFKLQRAVTYYI